MFGHFSNTVEESSFLLWACLRFLNRRDPFHMVGGSRQREALLLGRLSPRDPEVRLRNGPQLHRHQVRLQLRRRPQSMVSDAHRSGAYTSTQLNSCGFFILKKIIIIIWCYLTVRDFFYFYFKWFPWINLQFYFSLVTHYLQKLDLGIPVSDSAHQPFQKNGTSRWIFCLN